MRKGRCGLAPIVCAILAWCSHLAVAQVDSATRSAENLQRQLNDEDEQMRKAYFANAPISERLAVDYGGTFRYAFNIIDNAQSQEQYEQVFDLRLFVSIELDGAHRFYGRLRGLYNEWDFRGTRPGGVDYDDVGWQDPIGELYWYEFNLAGLIQSQTGSRPDFNLTAKVGRQYVIWGQGASLSNYMYAGIFEASTKYLKLTTIVGETAGNDTIDWDVSRPGYDTDTQRLYAGGKLEFSGIAGHRPYAYLLNQNDLNGGQSAVVTVGGIGYPTTFDYNSTYAGIGSNGALGADLVYRAEFVYEFGTTLSDPIPHPVGVVAIPQVEDSISACAGVGGLTWLARDREDSRVDFQIVAGTGSSNRFNAGNTTAGIAKGSVDTSFNSLGYVNTGLVLAPDFANILCPSIGFSSTPLPGSGILSEMRFGVTAFAFMRNDANAPISVETRLGGSNYIGAEVDLSIEWRLMSDLDLNLRYGIFMPNPDVFFNGQSSARDFVYAGVTFAF